MLNEIKNKLEQELSCLTRRLNSLYSLHKISPLLSRSIRAFVLRKGKRVRPILFLLAYLGLAKKKPAAGLYAGALSLELLHDFMLVHDDIIDKSDTRRNKPSMHALLNNYLKKYRQIKFNGQDLAIAAGDVIYALAIEAFLTIKEAPLNKEKAIRKLIAAAVYTGSGEFLELLCGAKDLASMKKKDIYRIYDLKTANYTFASPLAIGATLAGASASEIDKLFKYGLYLGRAFQIKDDILGMFCDEGQTGKSALTDLKEAKKTILIWQTYHSCADKDKRLIKNIFNRRETGKADLLKMRRIIRNCGALDSAKEQIHKLKEKASSVMATSRLSTLHKELLQKYTQEILKV